MGWIDWLGMIFTFSSSCFLSKKMKVGWIFYVLSSLVWGAYGIWVVHSNAIVIMNVVLMFNGVRGFRNWGTGPS